MSSLIEGADVRAVAYHEAGHCVVAVLYGRTIRYVTITPGKRKNARGQVMIGRVVLRRPKLPQSPEREKAELCGALMECYAGVICESAATGMPVEPSTIAADHEAAVAMVSALLGPNADSETLEAKLKDLYLATAKLLSSDAMCRAVVRVAEALISKGTLTGRDVKRLVLQGPTKSPANTPGPAPTTR
jgi:hypothetical protein